MIKAETEPSEGVVLDATDKDDPFEPTKALTYERIDELRRQGKFECDVDYHSARNAIIRASRHSVFDLPPEVIFRARMVSEYLAAEADVYDTGIRFTRSDESLRSFIDTFEFDNKDIVPPRKGKRKVIVKPRQFRRLIARYEACGMHPTALMPNYRGRVAETASYTTEELMFQNKYARKYHSKDRPTKKDCWDQMHEAHDVRLAQGLNPLKLPSLRSFQRMIRDLGDYNNEWTRAGDPDRVARKYAIARGGLSLERPLQMVMLDEHKLNVVRILVKNGIWDFLHPDVKAKLEAKGRAWLSLAIDVYSRSILGAKLLFGAPNAAAAVATLAMVARNKDSEAHGAGALSSWPQTGTPEIICTDAGSAYVSNEFQTAVRMFTGNHTVPASKHPHLRAIVERVFRTFNQRYIHLLSGQTFENILLKDNYDPEKHAHITDEQLADFLVRLIVDCYHNTKHRGLWGATPLQAWYVGSQNGKGNMKMEPSMEKYGEIFGITLKRKISNYGITIMGLRYSDEDLQRLREKHYRAELTVKVNELDLSKIHVKHWSENKWRSVPAVFDALKGVTLWEWVRLVTYMKKKFGTDQRHTQEVVRKQLALTRELAQASRRDAGIRDPFPTEEDIKRQERTTFKGFQFEQPKLDTGGKPAKKGSNPRKDPFGPPGEGTVPPVEAVATETAAPPSKAAKTVRSAAPETDPVPDAAPAPKRTAIRIEKAPKKD
ncbi:Mu transposase C-terminal domain-containing protein [Rhizobium leguminosarum]|uniref:Mu transposase C-terminal domain-containing protein n=1 Tax=Rhizobium leguminosarum TaxID=384 RepID=UPI0013EF2DDE|nr:Mu transposase C-terminal domain-containing protein [Rhizobium leguminosarum]